MSQTLLATSVAVALTALLPSQTSAQPTGNRLIPGNSSIVLRVASPAKWRKAFGATQVAKLGNSNALSPLLGMASQRIEMGLQKLRDNGIFNAELAEGLLNDWQGDIVLSVQLDFDQVMQAMQFGDSPDMSFTVALTGDGKFDLPAVAKEFASAVEKTKPDSEVLHDLAVGDLTLRHTDNGGDEPDIALPVMIGNDLVMVGGTDLGKQAGKMLGTDNRFAADTTGSPLFLHVELGGLMKAMMAADADGAPFDVGAIFDAIGLSALQGMTLELGADGKAVVGEVTIGMKKENRGILDMLPVTSSAPKLLKMVPEGCESFSVSAMELGPLYKTVADVWTMMQDVVPMSFDQVVEGFANATKVRLKEDLLDHIGGEILVVQDLEAMKAMDPEEFEDNPAAMMGGSVYGFALRDAKAFGTALETALRSRGMHVGRKTEDYGNQKINRMKVMGMIELEYVVTDDALLLGVGGGEGTARALRSVLDTKAAGETAMAASIKSRVDALPAGWSGVSVTPLGATLEMVMKLAESSGELGGEMQMVSGILKGVAQDLGRLGIDKMVSATYCNEKGVSSRFRW